MTTTLDDAPAKKKKAGGLTGMTKLPPQLEAQLAQSSARRERKIADSALGIAVALFGLAMIGATFYLALKQVDRLVLLGGATFGAVILAFGMLLADRETVWPVLRGMVALLASLMKLRSKPAD
jgi:hypothetical protein